MSISNNYLTGDLNLKPSEYQNRSNEGLTLVPRAIKGGVNLRNRPSQGENSASSFSRVTGPDPRGTGARTTQEGSCQITQNININLIQSGMISQTPEVSVPAQALRNGGVQSKRYYSKTRGGHAGKRPTANPITTSRNILSLKSEEDYQKKLKETLAQVNTSQT